MNADKSEGDLNISPRRAEWAGENINEETRHWLDEDERYFIRQSLSTPCLNVLKKCDGIYIEDLEGRRIMDFHGNNVHQVGFAHPRIIEAIKKQLDTLPFCTRRYTNEPAILLAKKLTELAPGDLNKVLFAPGGTAVIGMALKLARMATGRFKTISMWDSFHGASLDAISIGGEAIFRNGIGPLLPGAEHIPPPDPLHCPFCNSSPVFPKPGLALDPSPGFGKTGLPECNLKCADYVEYVLEKEGDVAAVIAETVRSTPFIPPREYWQRIRAACDKHGAMLILDEIPTCLGRTGTMFACEHYGIVPDMLCIGKGLGGGIMPLAALIAREVLDIMPDRALGHYTHEKNPVACAAGLATIETILEGGLLDNARRVGEHALERMNKMKARHAIIGDVRGLGLLLGMELVKDRQTHERATDAAERVMYGALSNGLSFKITMGNILTLTPPLTITLAEMDRAMDILEKALASAEGG